MSSCSSVAPPGPPDSAERWLMDTCASSSSSSDGSSSRKRVRSAVCKGKGAGLQLALPSRELVVAC